MKEKKLTRSTQDKMVAGVAAGLGHYLGIDVVIVRLISALLILSNPPLGLIVYVILALIMPEDVSFTDAKANGFSDEEIIIKDA